MKKRICLTLLACMLSFISSMHAQHAQPKISLRNANYSMKVQLNPDTKQITGTETIHWRNISNTTLHELQFHLYINAFRNNLSTFMREGGYSRMKENEGWGWIEVESMQAQGRDLLGSAE